MSNVISVEALRAATDVEFVFLLCLRRHPHDFEVWVSLGVETAKLVVQMLPELHAVNTRQAALIDANQDFSFAPELDLVQRAFRIFLKRDPSDDERTRWTKQPMISATELIGDLLMSAEALVVNGLEPSQNQSESFRLQRSLAIAHGMQHEAFCEVTLQGVCTASRALDKLHRLTGRSIVVGLHLFALNDNDLARLSATLSEELNGAEVRFVRLSADDVIGATSLQQIDLLLTNNNFLYDRSADQFRAISKAPCVTACWLWDNHHQFDFSKQISLEFDIVFPAHSNGQIYLHAGRALVASTVPCCTIQFGADEAKRLFAETGRGERTNGLYGRFNSYPGRIRSRDTFLTRAAHELEESAITVSDYKSNPWAGLSAAQRFEDLASRKAVICSPIYNDMPARVFDTLLAGAIPIIPVGLPDVDISFTFDEQRSLPLIRYIQNDLDSLKAATDCAVRRFDAAGIAAAEARHVRARGKDMLLHRVARMVLETTEIAKLYPKQRRNV